MPTPFHTTGTAIATYTPVSGHGTPTPTLTPKVVMPSPQEPVVIRQNVVRPASAQPLQVAVQLARAQHVTINIYTRSGKLVKTLMDQMQNAGTFDAVWQGVNAKGQVVGSGVYIVHIKTDTFEEKRKVVVVR
jgi:hypothetical protein